MEVHLYQDLLTLNWNMLFSFITVGVLILILKKFFFEKVHNFMEERRLEVENLQVIVAIDCRGNNIYEIGSLACANSN